MLGKPFLWPPGKQQKPAPWSPNWPEKLAWSCSSTPARLVYERGGNPAGSPLRRTPQAHTGALETQVRVSVCSSRTAAAAHARDRLTILCARSQQVNDVLMFADHLHHFHFRDEVSPVLLCGIRCTTRSHDISFIRMFYCGTLAGKISWRGGGGFFVSHLWAFLQPPLWDVWVCFCRAQQPRPEPPGRSTLPREASPASAWRLHKQQTVTITNSVCTLSYTTTSMLSNRALSQNGYLSRGSSQIGS